MIGRERKGIYLGTNYRNVIADSLFWPVFNVCFWIPAEMSEIRKLSSYEKIQKNNNIIKMIGHSSGGDHAILRVEVCSTNNANHNKWIFSALDNNLRFVFHYLSMHTTRQQTVDQGHSLILDYWTSRWNRCICVSIVDIHLTLRCWRKRVATNCKSYSTINSTTYFLRNETEYSCAISLLFLLPLFLFIPHKLY